MPSMNISLTPELMNIVHSQVDSGLYNNASEVIRDAIRQLVTNSQLLYELKLSKLRTNLQPGINQATSGQFAEYNLKSFIEEMDNQ